MVYLASSPEVAKITGECFYKCQPATPTKAAQDEIAAQQSWEQTARLAGVQDQSRSG